MRRILNGVCIRPALLGAFLALGGCGDDSAGPASLSYTGLTSQSSIDSNNASEMSANSYKGLGGTDMNIVGAVQSGGSGSSGESRLLTLATVLNDALVRLDPAAQSQAMALGATLSVNDSLPGDCGGSMSFSITADDSTGAFSGSLSFNAYCTTDTSGNTTISGSLTFSGVIDLNTQAFSAANMTFSYITITEGSETIAFSGTAVFTSTNVVFTDVKIKLSNADKVYRVVNYSSTTTQGAGYVDVTVSGDFYHPDYGYVTVSTSTPLRVTDGDDNPSSGVLLLTGSGGSQARLTALDALTFQVEVDADGDTMFETTLGPLNWSDF